MFTLFKKVQWRLQPNANYQLATNYQLTIASYQLPTEATKLPACHHVIFCLTTHPCLNTGVITPSYFPRPVGGTSWLRNTWMFPMYLQHLAHFQRVSWREWLSLSSHAHDINKDLTMLTCCCVAAPAGCWGSAQTLAAAARKMMINRPLTSPLSRPVHCASTRASNGGSRRFLNQGEGLLQVESVY